MRQLHSVQYREIKVLLVVVYYEVVFMFIDVI